MHILCFYLVEQLHEMMVKMAATAKALNSGQKEILIPHLTPVYRRGVVTIPP